MKISGRDSKLAIVIPDDDVVVVAEKVGNLAMTDGIGCTPISVSLSMIVLNLNILIFIGFQRFCNSPVFCLSASQLASLT